MGVSAFVLQYLWWHVAKERKMIKDHGWEDCQCSVGFQGRTHRAHCLGLFRVHSSFVFSLWQAFHFIVYYYCVCVHAHVCLCIPIQVYVWVRGHFCGRQLSLIVYCRHRTRWSGMCSKIFYPLSHLLALQQAVVELLLHLCLPYPQASFLPGSSPWVWKFSLQTLQSLCFFMLLVSSSFSLPTVDATSSRKLSITSPGST